jgi:hypothetical protein
MRRQPLEIHLHCVFPFEMDHMIDAAGLVIERIYGDFERSDFTDQASEMICIARVAGERGS